MTGKCYCVIQNFLISFSLHCWRWWGETRSQRARERSSRRCVAGANRTARTPRRGRWCQQCGCPWWASLRCWTWSDPPASWVLTSCSTPSRLALREGTWSSTTAACSVRLHLLSALDFTVMHSLPCTSSTKSFWGNVWCMKLAYNTIQINLQKVWANINTSSKPTNCCSCCSRWHCNTHTHRVKRYPPSSSYMRSHVPTIILWLTGEGKYNVPRTLWSITQSCGILRPVMFVLKSF